MALLQQFLRNQSSVLTHSLILKNKGFKTKEEKPGNASKKSGLLKSKVPYFAYESQVFTFQNIGPLSDKHKQPSKTSSKEMEVI